LLVRHERGLCAIQRVGLIAAAAVDGGRANRRAQHASAPVDALQRGFRACPELRAEGDQRSDLLGDLFSMRAVVRLEPAGSIPAADKLRRMCPDSLMEGFPPPSDSRVTLDNWQTPPFNRWAFQHMSEIIPSQPIRRGSGPVRSLEAAQPPVDLDEVPVAPWDGGGTLGEVVAKTYTDSVIVLHNGQIVLERYYTGMRPETRHLLMSVSKSVVGCVTGILVNRGLIDPAEQVSHYVPEILGSGYDGATVRNLLEMRTGVRFSEEYTDPHAEVRVMERHMGWRSPDRDGALGMYAYLATLDSSGAHGKTFEYHSADTDMLGWVCERAAGSRMADLISDLLWRPLSMEYDAEITCDAVGSAVHDGGISATTRDMARFGQMVLRDGRAGELTVVPDRWLRDSRAIDADIRGAFSASEAEPFLPGGWYRNQLWFVPGPSGDVLLCLGIHGQLVLVDHATNTVAVKFSTWPDAQNPNYLTDTIRAFTAAGRHLAGLPPVTSAPQDRKGGPLVDSG
jgi:CubicO group peptidase (beta-lactamase class C family)